MADLFDKIKKISQNRKKWVSRACKTGFFVCLFVFCFVAL